MLIVLAVIKPFGLHFVDFHLNVLVLRSSIHREGRGKVSLSANVLTRWALCSLHLNVDNWDTTVTHYKTWMDDTLWIRDICVAFAPKHHCEIFISWIGSGWIRNALRITILISKKQNNSTNATRSSYSARDKSQQNFHSNISKSSSKEDLSKIWYWSCGSEETPQTLIDRLWCRRVVQVTCEGQVIAWNGTRIAFVSRGNEDSFTTDDECSEQLWDLISFSQYLWQMLILSVCYPSHYTGLSVTFKKVKLS